MTMVRRSVRLKNKAIGKNNIEIKQSSVRAPETLDDLVKSAYNLFKEKIRNGREQSTDYVSLESEEQKHDDFIAVSSQLTDYQTLASEINPGVDVNDLYFKMEQSNDNVIPAITKGLTGLEEKQLMKKCVITSDFEKKETIPRYHVTFNALKKQKKQERDQSAGSGWFNMPAPEMTPELQRDMNVLRMRNVLDPKRHYKKNGSKKLPKYFQIGTIVSGPAEFYSSRLPKRERKQTIIESLLADAEFRRYNKRKYLEIQASKEKGRKKGFYRRNRSKQKRR